MTENHDQRRAGGVIHDVATARVGSMLREFAGLRRSAGLALLTVLAVLVGGAAYGLAQWRGDERRDAEEAFQERAVVAAGHLDSIMTNSLPELSEGLRRAAVDGEIQGRTLRDRLAVDGTAWVVDNEGGIARSWPPDAAAPDSEFLAAIRRGGHRVSERIVDRAGEPAIRVAVPTNGVPGVSGVIATYPLALAGTFIGSAIDRIPVTTGSRAAVIDLDGNVIVAAGIASDVTDQLAARASTERFGELMVDGERRLFAAAPVESAPWVVALSAPESEVMASGGGPVGWLGWAALLAFALTGLIGILLLMRVLRDAERLEVVSRDLRRRTREAEEASNAKNEFISSITHELRTPLAATRMFTELMKNDTEEPLTEGQRRNIEDIGTSTRHMMDLLEDTIDIARVEQGRLELRPERVSLAALAIGVVDGLQPLAAQRNVGLQLEADGSIGEVYLDPARLRQVMINFLSNALKFTPPGGSATMRVGRHGPGSIIVSVEDTGMGISEDQLPKVFSASTATSRPIREQDSNRGLGLALTKRLVEAMGGHVGVESTLGSGSTFYAVLPKVNAVRRVGVTPTDGASEESVLHGAPPPASTSRSFSAVGLRVSRRNGSNGDRQDSDVGERSSAE